MALKNRRLNFGQKPKIDKQSQLFSQSIQSIEENETERLSNLVRLMDQNQKLMQPSDE